MNYHTSYLCYLPQPSALEDSLDPGFDGSWHAQSHPIIAYHIPFSKHLQERVASNIYKS